jgi:aspartate/methionine/tyrosine aminotransferase
MESAARYVEDVDRDPVVLFDGLTKNWRYPGWRITWTVGPKASSRPSRAPARSSTAAAAARCSAPR